MILIFIGLIIMFPFSIYGSKNKLWNVVIFNDLICPIFAIVSGILILIYAGFSFSYFSSKYKADIINREYGTSYTQAEVFYASDVINTVRELNRSRIEAKIHIDGDQK